MSKRKAVLKGFIMEYHEQADEGYANWIFIRDKKKGMCHLDNGDHLKVFGEKGEILFDGEIKQNRNFDHKRWPAYWIQEGWTPRNWAKLFYHQNIKKGNGQPLRAELIKAK